MQTNTHHVTPSEWTEVAAGAANVLVQRPFMQSVSVLVSTSTPAPDARGVVLNGADTRVNISGLGEDDKVFVRAVNESTSAVVVSGGATIEIG